jgi:hypothetical protein
MRSMVEGPLRSSSLRSHPTTALRAVPLPVPGRSDQPRYQSFFSRVLATKYSAALST